MIEATRREALKTIKENEDNISIRGVPFTYRGENLKENVYKIPLKYLIYNRYNGRIGTMVKSYEKQYRILNAEDENDKKIIEGFLWESHAERNKTTMESLQKETQLRYGIVTSDGVIIDGNRRAFLLNKLYHEHERLGYTYADVAHCEYFQAIILPENAQPRDVQQLEAVYQMGEDKKLDYNPIEKYLKCADLKQVGFSEQAISEFMGETKYQIVKWLKILEYMEKYLEQYDYTGIYTRLEKTEGPFVDLTGYIESYKSGKAASAIWAYDDTDIADLTKVSFDYIRARYEGKEFRDIGKTGKGGSIFSHENLWREFLENHENIVPDDLNTTEDIRIKHPNENLSKLLEERDNEWRSKAIGHLEGNLRRYTQKLNDIRDSVKPRELLERALSYLESINYDEPSFTDDDGMREIIVSINRISYEMKKKFEKKSS